jgi:hypothetical protein
MSSIRIHNQTHKVIIKFFEVRGKNDLAAAAVSIPAVPYIQGHVVNALARLCVKEERTQEKKERRQEFSSILLTILNQTKRNQQMVKEEIDNQ